MLLYDIAGNKIIDLIKNDFYLSGEYFIPLEIKNLSSGIYFCSLSTETTTVNQKIILIK